jgi:hypothetical protein
MKRQSTLVLDLKQKIQATLKLIALRVKSLILQLIDLEQQLEEAMNKQLATVDRIIEALKGTQFHGVKSEQYYWDRPGSLVEVYANKCSIGYLRIKEGKINVRDIRPYRVDAIRSCLQSFACISEKIEDNSPSFDEMTKVYGFTEVQDAIDDVARENWDI